MTVTNTVKALGGKVILIAPTKAEIELGAGLIKDAVIQPIQRVGYNVVNRTL